MYMYEGSLEGDKNKESLIKKIIKKIIWEREIFGTVDEDGLLDEDERNVSKEKKKERKKTIRCSRRAGWKVGTVWWKVLKYSIKIEILIF